MASVTRAASDYPIGRRDLIFLPHGSEHDDWEASEATDPLDRPALGPWLPARLSMADEATMRLGDLAREFGSTLPRLSKVMDRFEARDRVVRPPDPANGRYTLATLTDAGRQKTAASAPEHVARVKRLVFDPLSAAQATPPARRRAHGHRRHRAPGARRGVRAADGSAQPIGALGNSRLIPG
ncbi:DNA-binding MarR family transcriptional regulator [Catenulispora sp. EB89]|uniref:MarR family winged helix-turn-helix transcriptional regulator n=1 Tax=Catenulispora sp. EB89 TaxID=3156257 RepID=UPI0035168269